MSATGPATGSATGNLNMAAKRTALGDRNIISRDTADAPGGSKSGATQNTNIESSIVTSRAQENRTQTKPKIALKKAFFQPAQRPSKTIAPAVSMSQIGPVANNTHSLRRTLGRASMSNFVYKDPQEDHKPAPAMSARAVPEERPAFRAAKVQPSATGASIKQERPVDLNPTKPESAQPKHYKPQNQQQQPKQQQPSRPSRYEEVSRQKPNDLSTQSSLLIPLDEASSPISPTTDDEDVTEPLYLDAAEDLTREQIRFLTNAPSQFLESSRPQQLAVRSLPESQVPEHNNPIRVPDVRPEPNSADTKNHPYPSSSVNAQPGQTYLSDYDDDEDDYYDDRGYTTAHSYRSRGDNTTGGVTTVMLPPKITKKGQAELEAAKRIVESRRTAQDIFEDAHDVSMVAEYGDEIFQYMKEQEVRFTTHHLPPTPPTSTTPLTISNQMALLPDPHYMDNQGEIQWSMRSVLMDWVVQVHTRFGLLPETLFLTVNYIDRFLSHKIVSLGKLQLVGATAIFIAAKYEEINCPSVQEIVYMVDSGYTPEEILKAERFMLSMLDFELGWPGPMSFLRRISKADDYDLETRTLAKYFLEVVIMDERFVASPPSYVAAGAHCLSRFVLRKGEWVRFCACRLDFSR